MPTHDSSGFRPPAPVALVTVRSPAIDRTVLNVPMLIDSGADVTLLPRELLGDIAKVAPEGRRFELEGFDGNRSFAPIAYLELRFLQKTFRGEFLLVGGTHGVLGRNILNAVSLLLDGPRLKWDENR